ncbi:anthranilate synthase component I [Oceanobacillus polygoni]|uniref:Anthranilate synthase component 1 n=1 Tax=Oceanobacillus polygoni TaxID=1235259 RepID=A0A9X0YYK2_9BACI|nr:anthranilate synthase component I [Oceanobacillus polygoni]MBP2079310.1 anthranilate synthase component 1 [Oceanobacillus polygoni]
MHVTKKTYKYTRIDAFDLTPIHIFKNLSGRKRFLLESTFQHEQKGKYSFLGVDPYQEVVGTENKTTIRHLEKSTIEIKPEHALNHIKKQMPKLEADLALPFFGGAIGYIGYDSIRQFEAIGETLPDDLNMPDIHFMLYQNVIVFDHTDNQIYLIAMNPDNQPEAVLDERIDTLKKALNRTESHNELKFGPIQFEPEMTSESFQEKVKIAKRHIKEGDVFQVVLSQRMTATIDEHPDFPFYFYEKLRTANPSPYMFYIDFEDYVILGASPESLIQTAGNEIITNPIAGTRARGKTPEEDEALMQELLSDKKEIAEHRMLVDLSRNDLGRVCETGSIMIPTYMKIEKYQHVMHIVSEVKGKLMKDLTGIDALISCLPAGTVSGAPKIRAMQIINDLEDKKRGAYGGGIGYINFNHDLNIALTIRSLILKNEKAYLQAGAGIVYDSIPENEYQETLNKARSLMEVQQVDTFN